MHLWLPGGKVGGKGKLGSLDAQVHSAAFKWIINKDLLTVQQSVLTVLCSMLCGILEG